MTQLRATSSGPALVPDHVTRDEHARRATIQQAAWTLADREPADVETDADRLARLGELYGDVCAAYTRGQDIDGEVLGLVAAGLAWIAARTRESAA
jgi:hypothetical protein